MAAFESWLQRWFHASWRTLIEFALVAAVLIVAEPTPRSLLYGGLLSLGGLLLRLWVSGYGGDPGVAVGPFRWLRQPHLLGSAGLFFGLCLAGRSAGVTAAAMVALVLLYRRVHLRSEAAMALRYGPMLAAYQVQVPAFVPRLWPLPRLKAAAASRFSWRQALRRGQHRELDAAVGLLAAWLALYTLSVLPFPPANIHLAVAAIVVVSILLRFVYYAGLRPRRR